MTTIPKRQWRGVTLIESLVIMSILSVVLTLSTGLIHASLHRHRQTQRALTIERDAWRLSHQLRRDVASATAAQVDGAKLELELPMQRTVVYIWRDDRAVRTEERPDESPRNEEFTWGENGVATVQELDSPRKLVVSLRPKEIAGPLFKELAPAANDERPRSPITNHRSPPALLQLEIPLPAEAP
jgi:type II secretory pathway component PulJ